MSEVRVILDLSIDVQTLLEQQDINLYEELQREMPSLRLELLPDPNAPAGSRDATTVILAIATLVSALTPLIIRILNQYTPPNRSTHWEIDETETRHSDGSSTIHRKYVRSRNEQRPWTALPCPDSHSSTPSKSALTPSDTMDQQQ